MAGYGGLTRRSLVVALPAGALATKAPVWVVENRATSADLSVLSVARTKLEAEAASLVAALRRASGCLRVDADGLERSGVSIFQTWRSDSDHKAFWTDYAIETHAPTFHRLEV